MKISVGSALSFLKIVQVRTSEHGFSREYRMNPYNPLTYVAIPVLVFVGLLMFGFVGFTREVDLVNPFKWQ